SYVDPAVTDIQESSFFIYVEPMRVSKAVKKYPDKAKEIRESVAKRTDSMSVGDGKMRQWFQTWFRAVKNFLTVKFEDKQAYRNSYQLVMEELDEAEKRAQSVAFIHYWYRDEDDKWRVSYWADDVLLEDRENPFWHGKLHFVAYVP